MKTFYRILSGLLTVLVLLCVQHTIPALGANNAQVMYTQQKVFSTATINDKFADNRVLVVFDNEASLSFHQYTTADFTEVNCKAVQDLSQASEKRVQAELYSLTSSICSRSTTANSLNESVKNYNQIVCLELTEAGKNKVLEAIDILEQRDDILYVGPDYEISICSTVSNDASYGQQWGLLTIKAPQAWDITTGSSIVTVGVLDTGIDGSHPDLVNRINTSLCRDFTSGSEVIVSPTDVHGHGTRVAGVIGAQGNNSIGIAGVNWNIRLVSLKILNNDGSGNLSHLINAIDFAESKGIRLLNMSAGETQAANDMSVYSAVKNYNGLLVCAAGNNESNNDIISVSPANYKLPNVITVGASNQANQWLDLPGTEGSNYGQKTVDLFAPGDYIYTTDIAGADGSTTTKADNYIYFGQTSAATPFVTGVAALLLSEYPDLSPCEIKDTILSNVDDCGTTFDTLCVSGGRLNAYKALTNVVRHSFTYANKDSDSHTVTCTECNYSFDQEHSYTTYTNNSSSSHTATCTECGYVATLSHTYTYTYISSNLFTHTAHCSKCSYRCSESHTWYSSPTNYRCTKCRLVTVAIPVLSADLPPALLLSLQQLGTDAAIAMDENTFLCQVDGQYYMVKGTTAEQALQTVLPQVNEAA